LQSGPSPHSGISDEFIPEIVRLKELDEVSFRSHGDAILMAQKLAFSLGLAVGISSDAISWQRSKLRKSSGRKPSW